jgi:septal ring factor EnvC (AmiA/AmiB activator)
MKTLIPFIILLSFAVTGLTQVPSTIAQARSIIKELNTELQDAKRENTVLQTRLNNANDRVLEAEKNTHQVQKNADALRDWGIDQQNQAFEWMSKHTKTLQKYHRLKTVASIVGGIFGLMFGIFCMRFVPPVYAAYAFALPIACTVIAAGWVWVFF